MDSNFLAGFAWGLMIAILFWFRYREEKASKNMYWKWLKEYRQDYKYQCKLANKYYRKLKENGLI